MKRLAIHKNFITLLLVIFAVVAMHTLQSAYWGKQKDIGEISAPHLLAR